jgi:ABC-type glutathione transport system ATPase component
MPSSPTRTWGPELPELLGSANAFENLSVTGVTKHFGSKRHPHVALDNVDLAVSPSSTIGIVGESGSGKSTLSRLMVGLDHPTTGTVSLDGTPIRQLLAREATAIRFHRSVQYIAQDTTSSFDPRRSLRDSVRAPLRTLYGLDQAESDRRVDAMVGSLGLDPRLADRRPHHVSGGQRQRFAIARALIVEPRLILCDEVVSALDVSVQGSILNLLKDYAERSRAAIVFVSHGLPATAFISEEMVVMNTGRIVERGATTTVIENPQDAYTRKLINAYRFDRSGRAAALVSAGGL